MPGRTLPSDQPFTCCRRTNRSRAPVLRVSGCLEYRSADNWRSCMSLTVQTEQRADVVVVSVAGELDMATAPRLQDQITDLLEKGRTRLVFDLAEVSFCDSTGLSVFVRAKNSTDEAGGVVRLAAPQRGVLRILEVSGLVEVLRTYSTVDEAVTAQEPALD